MCVCKVAIPSIVIRDAGIPGIFGLLYELITLVSFSQTLSLSALSVSLSYWSCKVLKESRGAHVFLRLIVASGLSA